MGKFGKKNSVSINPLDYNTTFLGESGIGKTTIIKQMCEKLAGDEGYIHFDVGNEDGAAAIEGIISEHIEDYSKAAEVVDDIVENKNTDYPNLKAVIWDTLDELVPLMEAEVIRLHNKKHSDNKIDSINQADGGFGKGQEHAANLMIDLMSKLRSVGVSNIIIGHVKRTDIIDPITQTTYSKITADTTQRYFNFIKNKQHFVALAYIDREIVKEKTGRKNIATKQDITTNKVVSESRVIAFRDNSYSVDSKSRFADIVDKIPFDVDELIKAMTDAIKAEKEKSGISIEDAINEQKVREEVKEKKASEASKSAKENKVDINRNNEILDFIQTKFKSMNAQEKVVLKNAMSELGIENFKERDTIPTSKLEKLLAACE